MKAKYYIRYFDDFIILHKHKGQLEEWKQSVDNFLKKKLKIELHTQKSRIIFLSKGVDFLGFRNFYYPRLLKKKKYK